MKFERFSNEDWYFAINLHRVVCMQLYDQKLTFEEMGQTMLCPNRYSMTWLFSFISRQIYQVFYFFKKRILYTSPKLKKGKKKDELPAFCF